MKPLYLSKTIWGAIVAVVGYVLDRLTHNPPQNKAEWIILIFEAVGVLLSAIGLRSSIRKLE